MNAIELLKTDHKTVEELFQQAEKGNPSDALFNEIKAELDAHAYIEETIFYPAIQETGDKALVEITAEALQEHAQMKTFLGDLSVAGKTDFKALLTKLIEDVRHHVKEEEGEMFPLVRSLFSSDDLEKVGLQMKAEKERFKASSESIHA